MKILAAAEMPGAARFREELARWAERILLDPGWEIVLGADDMLDGRAMVKTCVRFREATVMVNPAADGDPPATACHEVMHIALKRMDDVAQRIIAQLPAPLQEFAKQTWAEAEEEVTEGLARAFMRAYGESDG